MKRKSFFLLLVFLLTLIPIESVHASSELSRTLENSISLMYISDAILLDESDIDDSPDSIGMLSPLQRNSIDVDTNPLLARIIHAKKMQRNDLDANCRLLIGQLKAGSKDCEADKVNSYCQKKRSEINIQIGFYHKMRGDQRKFFTKMWHSVKRNSSNFWHKIGPLGRRILRKVGPEVLQVVASGGTLNTGVLKTIFKHHAKSVLKDRLKQVVLQGMQRLLQGQIEIAQAAGVDICEEKEEETTAEDQSSESSSAPWDSSPELDIASSWICSTNVGPWGTWMQNGDPNTRIDLTELVFNLQAAPPSVTFDFSFFLLGGIPLYSAEGNFYDHLNTEEITYGEGVAEWDETTFYGTVTINKESYLYYPSKTDEFKDRFDRAVIGALSPDQGEIHLCFHTHTKEQFNSIKQQLFDQFKSHCTAAV